MSKKSGVEIEKVIFLFQKASVDEQVAAFGTLKLYLKEVLQSTVGNHQQIAKKYQDIYEAIDK